MVKGLFGRDAAFALVFFAVTSLLTAAVLGLSRSIDVAVAAAAVGGTVVALLVLVAVLASRPPKQP